MSDDNNELANLMRAIVLLLLDQRAPAEEERAKTEVLLARAGFSAPQIADLVDKKVDAVRKTLQRAGKANA